MKLFKNALKLFKENFYFLFLLDILFFSITFLCLWLVKIKLAGYIQLMQEVSPAVQSLSSQEAVDLIQLQTVVNTLSPIVSKAMFFVYLFPIIVFLVWCFAQSLIWGKISDEKFSFKHFLKFLVISLPLGVFFSYLVSNFLFKFYYIIIVILLAYFSFIAYALMDDNLVNTLKKTFIIGIKRVYKLFPLSLLLLVLYTLVLVSSFILYSYLYSQLFELSMIVYVLLVIVSLVFLAYAKILFCLFVKR